MSRNSQQKNLQKNTDSKLENDSKKQVKVLNFGLWRAARNAVFMPITGPRFLKKENVFEGLKKVRKLWSEVVNRVHQSGWEKMNEKDVYMWKLCPSFGIATTDKKRRCQRRIICPFCHGRQVAQMVLRCEKFATQHLDEFGKPIYDLVSFEMPRLAYFSTRRNSREPFEEAIDSLLNYYQQDYIKSLRRFPKIGLFSYVRFALEEDNELWIKVRCVGFVPRSWDQSKFELDRKIKDFSRVPATRQEMYKIIGKSMRYNPKLFFDLRPAELKMLLDRLHRVRLLKCSYGLFKKENK